MARVTLTAFRPRMSEWIRHVQQPEEFVIITNHGREVAALISTRNLDLLMQQWDEHRTGPINPATGRPFGRQWVIDRFLGHYDRHRDPEAHLRPRRRDCPWLGRPFEWPPRGTPDKPPVGPHVPLAMEPEVPDGPKDEDGAEETEAPVEAPAPSPPWWRALAGFWRR